MTRPHYAAQQTFFQTGQTLPEAFRRRHLRMLAMALRQHENTLLAALNQDLGKSAVEAYASEIGFVQNEIAFALRHLHAWMKPDSRPTPLLLWPGKSRIFPRPKGAVLILGPWNYPLGLLLTPAVGAMAAGNCATLKPSELAPACSDAIAAMLQKTFPPEYLQVQQGGPETAAELLQQPWDHIFFTGNTAVGRLVMQAAAKHPSPITLELGGKSPCLVLADADIATSARRIAWAKFLNAGQTCVAPDYILVHAGIKAKLVAALRHSIQAMFGPDPLRSPDYGRIVNARHFLRLQSYLKDCRVLHGGQTNESERYIAPALVEAGPDSAIMQEEIFGPILPVLEYSDLDQAAAFIRRRPKPLALYIFTRNRRQAHALLGSIPAGGACVNDALSQLMNPHLPFGGLGASGLGAYHGRYSFDSFTHYESVMCRGSGWLEPRAKYPPYRIPLAMLKRIQQWLS